MVESGAPPWLRGILWAERAVGPPLKEVLASGHFFTAVGLITGVRTDVRRRTERITRQVWHQVNLPAGSDVTRLLAEIGTLQMQVRELSVRVEGAAPVRRRSVPRA